jgi:hypothetical protein
MKRNEAATVPDICDQIEQHRDTEKQYLTIALLLVTQQNLVPRPIKSNTLLK